MQTQAQGPVAPPLKNVAPIPQAPIAEPTLHLPGIGPIQARKMVIASVHFEPRQERFMHSNRQTFVLPAAKKGEVSYLNVYDSQQWVPQWPNMNEAPENVPMPVPVDTIARDLVNSWGWLQLNGQKSVRIGIDVIQGEQCTEAEYNRLVKMETAACRATVEAADRKHASGKGEIDAFDRACLDWLGSEKRPWYHQIELGRMKLGPISGVQIPMNATGDAGIDLLDWYEKHGFDPLDNGDTFIAELLKKKRAAKK